VYLDAHACLLPCWTIRCKPLSQSPRYL
jgi:hypothetical protein